MAEEKSPLPSPEDILLVLSALLGASFIKERNGSLMHSNCPFDWSCIPWEPYHASDHDQESPDVDFSSFPSLSLERSPVEQFESHIGCKKDVEAHVSALLSRPILVSNANDAILPEENESDSPEFVASKCAEVPGLVLQNFFNSFSILMNSRLRAHATFLARHGLVLLENSASSLEDGVVGVEQKLETMLEMGRLISTSAIVTSFHGIKDDASSEAAMDGTCQVSMPLVMDAAIDITLPGPRGAKSETVTVAFHTTGTITGVFSSSNALLRAVGVELDMSKLLPCMIEQAASVISRIVDMTNAAYSLSAPSKGPTACEPYAGNCTAEGPPMYTSNHSRDDRANLVEPDAAVISPSLRPQEDADMEDLQDFSLEAGASSSMELSPEKCEHLVDFILHETDHSILSPSTGKNMKVLSTVDAGSLPAAA